MSVSCVTLSNADEQNDHGQTAWTLLREGVYQLRVMVPKDLSAAYGGKTRLTSSLSTGSHR
ncbi:DUF6538 domain-containing protein, partial [Ramlibacter sp.]|uniref:DUF6538 domain-containing protein n=1 Tax=Ramlibacter sp. TaxID=1917967 RepID=UPI00345C7454